MSSTLKTTLHLFKRSVQVAAGVTLFKDKVGDLRWCEGGSMLPTLNVKGDLLLQIPLSSFFNVCFQASQSTNTLTDTATSFESITNQLNLKRGDLVNFISPLNPSVLACKRIIGLPGDRIMVDQNPKTSFPSPDTPFPDIPVYDFSKKILLTIPNGHLWLEGDNYAVSIDSRTYGPVPIGLVSGKIVARVWPNLSWLCQPFHYK
ncbi:hypothetical protein PCANC_25413 [Puccinia coronata f. sp. avenae]|uniref:Mitochondrial inner membrane protease subunit n=1 Tax=Puccinia coronata f. sp. avenae TaxID=200324 RepID=A0A2N5SAE2_9BASI|nr:hypothetical protein PCANC_25413 [Puccinia coronata f. sp. avenae]